MKANPEFWTKMAAKYRTRAISDEAAYEATLARVMAHLSADAQVLELGCGTGGTALKLAPHAGQITASDFASGMIEQANAREAADNVRFVVADVFDRQFDAGSFDAVLGFNLIHLVENPAEFVARVHDLLKPGGVFISKTPCLTDPSAALHWRLVVRIVVPVLQAIGKAPFVRFLKIGELQDTIRHAGFEIVETGNYPDQPPSHFIVARKV